jgi:hypothetical protein
VHGREWLGSSASVRWKNHHVPDEHMSIATLFFEVTSKNDNFLLNFCHLYVNSGCAGAYCFFIPCFSALANKAVIIVDTLNTKSLTFMCSHFWYSVIWEDDNYAHIYLLFINKWNFYMKMKWSTYEYLFSCEDMKSDLGQAL